MKFFPIASLVLLLLVSCTPRTLSYFNSKNAKLRDYKTYRIFNEKLNRTNLSKDGRKILDTIESSLRRKMEERGYEESNISPDLLLRYEITNSQQTGNNIPFNPLATSGISREVLIIVDLKDAKRSKVFWQASYDITQKRKDFLQKQATEMAISEIFYTFPYKAEDTQPDEDLANKKLHRNQLKVKHRQERKEAKNWKKELNNNL